MKKDRPLTLYEKQKLEKPSIEELANEYLNIELNRQLSDFTSFLKQNNMTPRLYTTNLFQVKYKGKYILKIRMAGGPKLQRDVYSVFIWPSDKEDLEDFFITLSDDMKNFYLDNICLCKHCSKCLPKSIIILDKKIENYCNTTMSIDNPTEQQYKYIKKIVLLRKEYIKNKS